MSLLRPRTFEAPLMIEGEGLFLRPPQTGGLRSVGGIAQSLARTSATVGADLAAR